MQEVDNILDCIGKNAFQPKSLSEVHGIGNEAFTSGDEHLDKVLGGGIRTGMLWEIAGERFVFLSSAYILQLN